MISVSWRYWQARHSLILHVEKQLFLHRMESQTGVCKDNTHFLEFLTDSCKLCKPIPGDETSRNGGSGCVVIVITEEQLENDEEKKKILMP